MDSNQLNDTNKLNLKLKIIIFYLICSGLLALTAVGYLIYFEIFPFIHWGGTIPAEQESLYLFILILIPVTLGVGILDLVLSYKLSKFKKWAFILTMIQFSIVALGNVVMLFSGNLFGLVSIINIIFIYLLYNERNKFLIPRNFRGSV